MPDNHKLPEVKLTTSQQKVLDQLIDFVFHSTDRIFILKGYAGTGKTTLMRFLIEELEKGKKFFKLLAPTGRAAKILHDTTRREANTIHHVIYGSPHFSKDLSDLKKEDLLVEKTGQITLNFESVKVDEKSMPPTIYIVDESSMVADVEQKDNPQSLYGNGRLLSNLIDYDRRSESKFVFIGDPCQLNPINEIKSPALIPEYFEQFFGLSIQEASLTQIMRQKEGNDLINASKMIRKKWAEAPETESVYYRDVWDGFPVRHCKETRLYQDLNNMVGAYISTVKSTGYADSIFISPSNAKCFSISQTVRNALGFTQPFLQKDDLLMVVQNNGLTGLLNGDMVEVVQLDPHVEYRAGIEFQMATVKEVLSKKIFQIRLMLTTLKIPQPNLDKMQNSRLFVDFFYRMKDRGIDQKHNHDEFMKATARDPYLNALRCNYGYAITCHKAQGGEWENVFVDFGVMAKNLTKSKCQWAYTAVTRAKQTLHVLDKLYIQ